MKENERAITLGKPAPVFFAVVFLFLAGLNLAGQTNDPPARETDPLVIKIAVIGPGDELYFWWGHIGLLIEDNESGRSRFYDWGIFSFENENFFANFAFGRLLYTCGASAPSWNLTAYTEANRDITLYTLNLPPESKRVIRDYAEWTVLPENKDYYYHHFRDNCATRIRDILDMATGGQFKATYGPSPGRFTLREHVRRHTYFNPFFDWFLNFLMGRGIDTQITEWDEMFLPSEIARRLKEFTYKDSDGVERRLLAETETRNLALRRPPVLDAPPRSILGNLALGAGIALVLALVLALKSRETETAGKPWALSQAALGLFFGGAGTVLCFMTFFTNHDYTYHNINALFTTPLLLAALPLGILYAARLPRGEHHAPERAVKTLWTLVLLLGALSIPLNLLIHGQRNLPHLSLILPASAVLSWLPDLCVFIRREYLWRWFNK